jgi:3-phenylpropionate/trans-cinnamate dioxygenase ferredoxin subunit
MDRTRLKVESEGNIGGSLYNYRLWDEEKIEYVPVASVDEVPDGQRLFVSIDEFDIVVFQIAGQYFAIADLCSHDDGPLGEGELIDHEVICPRHGAHFDVRTGKATSLPAIVDIPAYPVRLSAEQIEVGIPLEID